MSFAANLARLPDAGPMSGITLTGPDGEVERIANGPGSQGSVRIYAYLLDKYGCLDAQAATEGLELYAEHGAAARAHPGSHPNIDRLLAIGADGRAWHGQAD